MSIALFNIRLTTLTTTFWIGLNWAFFVICTAYTFAALFLNIFKCNPQYASFDLLRIADSGKVPECLSVSSRSSILRLNLALDFTALAIPVVLLWKVQMSWMKKARIFGVLSIGLIACIASAMALVSQYTLEKDPLWNYTTLLAWLMVDLVVSLVAACAPSLAYLLPCSSSSEHDVSISHNPATVGGSGSRLSTNEYASRERPVDGENEDSDREECCIIMKQDSKIHGQDGERSSNAHSWRVSDHSGDDSSLKDWRGVHR
jgi:hypothetical protein